MINFPAVEFHLYFFNLGMRSIDRVFSKALDIFKKLPNTKYKIQNI